MAEKAYEANIISCTKEHTARERIKLKDMSNALSIDALLQDATDLEIDVDYYAKVAVHNEKSTDKDYEKLVIVATNGTKYVTGSPSFVRSLEDIVSELDAAGEAREPFAITVFRKESKNYSGKYFITCSLA